MAQGITTMMKASLVAAVAVAALAGPAQAQTVGVNAAIRNNVAIKTARDTELRPARLKERVGLGDDIVTAAASVLQILLLDRTSLTVGANARMKVDRFVYDPARSASSVGASVAKGAFRFMSGKAMRGAPGQSSVTTPAASIGIRGTIFEGAVGPDAVRIARGETAVGNAAANNDAATLIVLRGPGTRAQGDERPGAIDVTMGAQMVTLDRPGLALFVPGPDTPAIGPFAISDAGLAMLHELLRTSPDARRTAGGIDLESNPIVDMMLECESGFAESGGDHRQIVSGISSSSISSSSSSSSSSSAGGCGLN